MSHQFQSTWEEALEAYLDYTDRSHRELKLLKRLENPDDLEREINSQEARFNTFRERGPFLISKLKSVVQPCIALSGFASLAFSSTTLGPVSVFLGAVVFIFKAANGVSKVYDWIEELFQKLAAFTTRLNEYLAAGIGPHLKAKVVQILQCLLEIFAHSEKTINSGRWKKFAAVLFLGQDESVKASFDKLASLFTDEQQLLTAIAFVTNQKIEERVKSIEEKGDKTLETAIRLEAKLAEREKKEKRDAMLNWVSSTDFTAQHSDNVDLWQSGTGEWFLSNQKFQAWVSRSGHPTLFCPGIPGAGKTVIATIVIDYLLKKLGEEDIGVAFAYCNYNRRGFQTAKNTLAAILRQLLQALQEIPKAILDVHSSKRDCAPSIRDICDMLKLTFVEFPTTYLVVDALDECMDQNGTHHELLNTLLNLQKSSNLRILVTSRFVPDIEESFKDGPTLEIRANKDDLSKYIKSHLDQRPRCVKGDKDLQAFVREKIVDTSGGMFLLAQLYVSWLQSMVTKKQVLASLESIALSRQSATTESAHIYSHAYNRTMERIESQPYEQRALAQNALCWVSHARRPLTIMELCCALAVEAGEEEFCQDNMPDIEDIVLVCAGLVVVDQQSKTVRLVHYTTQEYLERRRSPWLLSAEANITAVCLTYLAYECFSSGASADKVAYQRRVEKYPFLQYAAQSWSRHILTAEDQVAALACRFLRRYSLVDSAMEAMAVKPYQSSDWKPSRSLYIKKRNGLHLISEFGLTNASKLVISAMHSDNTLESSINSTDGNGDTPILLAASKGRFDLVKLLVENGADINLQAERRGNALLAAGQGNYKEITKLLLDNGSEINLNSEEYGTALYCAVDGGYESMVKMLLDEGADVSSNAMAFWNGPEAPLFQAVLRGNEQIVQLLLEKGANANARGGVMGTVLRAAAYEGNERIVRLILEYGAEIHAFWEGRERFWTELNPEYEDRGRAIQAAAAAGKDKIVQLLLNYGAHVNEERQSCPTALEMAAKNGHCQTVKLLLRHITDTNSQYSRVGDALNAAAWGGHEQVINILLDAGIDVNTVSNIKFGTAIRTAAAAGHWQVLLLLHARGGDLDAREDSLGNFLKIGGIKDSEEIARFLSSWSRLNGNRYEAAEELALLVASRNSAIYDAITAPNMLPQEEEGEDPLYKATEEGEGTLVRQMIEMGGNLTYQDGYYGNALQVAVVNGHVEIATMLMDSDIDINAQCGFYGNALQAASLKGPAQLVKALLERSVDINRQGGRYGSALQAAANGGHAQIVEMLINAGADVNYKGGCFGTALQAVSSRGDKQLVQYLISKGADINAEGGEHGSVLFAAVKNDHPHIVSILIDAGVNVNSRGTKKFDPFFYAAILKHEQILKQLLDAGVNDIDAQSEYPFSNDTGTALQEASWRGFEGIVEELLNFGANTESKLGSKGTPLYLAACNGHENVVNRLINSDASINATSGVYGYAFMGALSNGHERIAKLLYDRGADVHAPTKDFCSSLAWACGQGSMHIMKMLLGMDASVHGKPGYGRSPLQAASSQGHTFIVEVMLDLGAKQVIMDDKQSSPLFEAASNGQTRVVELLLAHKTYQNEYAELHGSLNSAAANGHLSVVNLLLDARSALKSNLDITEALEAAIQNAHDAIFERLLQVGVGVSMRGYTYGPALQAALSTSHNRAAENLLELGADVNCRCIF